MHDMVGRVSVIDSSAETYENKAVHCPGLHTPCDLQNIDQHVSFLSPRATSDTSNSHCRCCYENIKNMSRELR